MTAANELASVVGVVVACAALAVGRATYYRRFLSPLTCAPPRLKPPRALTEAERQSVLQVANSDRFLDVAPPEIVATLLDEGVYYCSTRSFYRVLAAEGQVRERRDQRTHPEYKKPELLATGPNQVWSWDITKLLTNEKWKYLFVYVVLDIYSRYVVGWLVAEHENATHAKRLISETYKKEDVEPGQLTIHGDRGAPMTSKTLAQLMADLTITKSHSRPQVSDDNPFSESNFKTMKYQPDFPGRFSDIESAQVFLRRFFDWYNNDHRHSGIAMLTPADVHHGRSGQVLNRRQEALDVAFAAHPERFVRGAPRAAALPAAVYINPPAAPSTLVIEPVDAGQPAGLEGPVDATAEGSRELFASLLPDHQAALPSDESEYGGAH